MIRIKKRMTIHVKHKTATRNQRWYEILRPPTFISLFLLMVKEQHFTFIIAMRLS